MEQSRSKETTNKTGKEYGNLARQETSNQSILKYEFVITVQLERSLLTMLSLLLLKDNVLCSGAILELESQDEPGQKREHQRILRIRNLSFGAATKVKKTLLSTNFEETSQSGIYSDGWIDILSSWKLRDPVPPSKRRRSGSQATSPQNIGTPTSTKEHITPCSEDS